MVPREHRQHRQLRQRAQLEAILIAPRESTEVGMGIEPANAYEHKEATVQQSCPEALKIEIEDLKSELEREYSRQFVGGPRCLKRGGGMTRYGG